MPRPSVVVRAASALVAPLAWAAAGCSPAPAPTPPATPAAATHDADHDHEHADHEHPETLAAGIAALKKQAAEVAEHVAADRDRADDAVHAVAHLLDDMPGLVRESALAEDGKAAAMKALDELFECFDKLDVALHAAAGEGDPPAEVHASVAERIGAAIKALEEAK